MKNKLLIVVILSFFLNSCKEEKSVTKNNSEVDHYYSFRDENLYGYKQQKEADGTEKPLLMIKYVFSPIE